MVRAPVSGFSLTCFLFFAVYTACFAAYYHKYITFFGDLYSEEVLDRLETRRNLLVATTAMLGLTTFFFYPLYKCLGSQTMLALRLLGNLAAMLVFLGFQAGVLSEDGIDSQAVRDHSFSNLSDWGSTVAFGCAWVLISTFEINETVICHRTITRLIVKFQVFMFWALYAVAFLISGEELLDDVDVTDTEGVYSKLLFSAAAASGLAALMFAFYCTCEVQEFLRLHMLFGGLFVILRISANVYESVNYRKDLKEHYSTWINRDAAEQLYEHYLIVKNIQDVGNSFLLFAVLQIVGFDNYFFVKQQNNGGGRVADNKVIQLELKL